jgi:hypothetical protein
MSPMKTNAISPKAALAFLYPFLATLAATVSSWIVTGAFSAAEIRVALAGLVASGIAALGAYTGKPGDVESDQEIPDEFEPDPTPPAP